MFVAADVPLQGAPLFVLSVGVLHADTAGGLPSACLAPGVSLAIRAWSFGFLGGALTCSGNSLARPR